MRGWQSLQGLSCNRLALPPHRCTHSHSSPWCRVGQSVRAQCRFLMAQTPETSEPWVGLMTLTEQSHPAPLALK